MASFDLNDYVQVNERIEKFYQQYPDGSIQTEMILNENGMVIFKAYAYRDQEDKKPATGHAMEREGSTYINKTSHIENCETSAVGRALAMLGFEIKKSVASREEVENAKLQQEMMKPIDKATATALINTLKAKGYSDEDINKSLTKYKVKSAEELTELQYGEILQKIKGA